MKIRDVANMSSCIVTVGNLPVIKATGGPNNYSHLIHGCEQATMIQPRKTTSVLLASSSSEMLLL